MERYTELFDDWAFEREFAYEVVPKGRRSTGVKGRRRMEPDGFVDQDSQEEFCLDSFKAVGERITAK